MPTPKNVSNESEWPEFHSRIHFSGDGGEDGGVGGLARICSGHALIGVDNLLSYSLSLSFITPLPSKWIMLSNLINHHHHQTTSHEYEWANV